jgi:iron complex outermembrane receptor protein
MIVVHAYGQTDSLTYLDEVQVLGVSLSDYAMGSVINSYDLQPDQKLSALFNRSSLYFKEYGPGQLTTIAFRGTSANHTSVLWNGIPVNSPTLGQTDFSIWPAIFSESIVVQKGNAGSLATSGGIGGSVYIDNKSIKSDSLLMLRLGFGSFSSINTAGKITLSTTKLKSQSTFYFDNAKNDFPVEVDGLEVDQPNAAVRSKGLSQRFNLLLGDHFLSSEVSWVQNDREIQPSLGSTSRDNLLTENLRIYIGDEFTLNGINAEISMGMVNDKTVFNETDETNAHQYSLSGAVDISISESIQTHNGVMLTHTTATSSNFNGAPTQNQLNVFSSWNIRLMNNLISTVNLREIILENSNQFVPSLGLNYNYKFLTLRGQISEGYRIPTLNDLFWEPGGNEELESEKSISYEAGVDLNRGDFSFSTTGFRSFIDDWIQWVPREGIWSPRNIREVRTWGIESQIKQVFRIDERFLNIEFEHSWTRSNDMSQPKDSQLPYVPEHAMFLGIGYAVNNTLINVFANYTGRRFTTLTNSTRNSVDDFITIDVSLNQTFRFLKTYTAIDFSINNLLNTTYQNIQNLAMPGINYAIGLTTKI